MNIGIGLGLGFAKRVQGEMWNPFINDAGLVLGIDSSLTSQFTLGSGNIITRYDDPRETSSNYVTATSTPIYNSNTKQMEFIQGNYFNLFLDSTVRSIIVVHNNLDTSVDRIHSFASESGTATDAEISFYYISGAKTISFDGETTVQGSYSLDGGDFSANAANHTVDWSTSNLFMGNWASDRTPIYTGKRYANNFGIHGNINAIYYRSTAIDAETKLAYEGYLGNKWSITT